MIIADREGSKIRILLRFLLKLLLIESLLVDAIVGEMDPLELHIGEMRPPIEFSYSIVSKLYVIRTQLRIGSHYLHFVNSIHCACQMNNKLFKCIDHSKN